MTSFLRTIGGAEPLRFQAPSGHMVELYYAMDYTGNLLPTVNPAPWPDALKGIAPPRLDPTLVTAPDRPRNSVFPGWCWSSGRVKCCATRRDADCRGLAAASPS